MVVLAVTATYPGFTPFVAATSRYYLPMRHALVVMCLTMSFGYLIPRISAQIKVPVEPSGVDIHTPIDLPVTVKGGYPVMPPRPVSTPDPKTPKDSVKGTVLIKCVVGTDGRVHEPRITQSLSPQNDASALEVVKRWKFLPTRGNGKPVAVRTTVLVVF
jgi:TonB family protein